MSDINLINWRDKRRKKRTKSYVELNVFFVSIVLFTMVMINVISGALISKQEAKNNFLKSEDQILNVKLTEISEYESKVKAITERMKIINDLQSDRITAVIIFDEVVSKTPKEIKLTSLKRENGFILIEGVSVSQLTISNYLKNLSTSKFITSPRLEQVIADEKVDGFERSRFYIKANETINLE